MRVHSGKRAYLLNTQEKSTTNSDCCFKADKTIQDYLHIYGHLVKIKKLQNLQFFKRMFTNFKD